MAGEAGREEMNKAQQWRLVFLISGLTDAVLGGIALLIFFGAIPLDYAGAGLPRWMFGAFGAVLFFSGIGVLTYQLTRTDNPE